MNCKSLYQPEEFNGPTVYLLSDQKEYSCQRKARIQTTVRSAFSEGSCLEMNNRNCEASRKVGYPNWDKP